MTEDEKKDEITVASVTGITKYDCWRNVVRKLAEYINRMEIRNAQATEEGLFLKRGNRRTKNRTRGLS